MRAHRAIAIALAALIAVPALGRAALPASAQEPPALRATCPSRPGSDTVLSTLWRVCQRPPSRVLASSSQARSAYGACPPQAHARHRDHLHRSQKANAGS